MECACIGTSWDGEGWDFAPSITLPVARKDHNCSECRRVIPPGEHYSLVRGKSEGEWFTFRACVDCKSVMDNLFCSYTFEGVWEDLTDHINRTGGDIGMWSKIALLTPAAREKVCDIIQQSWEYVGN